MKHPLVRYIVTIALSAGALYLAFHGQNFVELFRESSHVNFWIILLGVGFMFASHFVRAWRWTVIMRPTKAKVNVFVAYRALLAGYGMNNILPRSAELIRPFVVAKHENLFLSGTIASILVERITDLISMVLFLMISLLMFPDELSRAFPNIASATVPLMAGLIVLLVLTLIMVFSANKTLRAIYYLTRRWPEKIRNSVDRAASEFSIGLRGVRAGGAVPIIVGTIGIWIFYVLSMYVSLYAFPEPQFMAVGIVGAFFLRVLSGLAFMIPTPGGTGSYHFFISQALFQIFGVPLPLSIVYATLTHAANYLITTLVGAGLVIAEGISLKDFSAVIKAESAKHHLPGVDRETPTVSATQNAMPRKDTRKGGLEAKA